MPRIGLHGLRHTYATAALRAGVSPEIVSRRLHRLFCLLDRGHPDGPTLVMLDGESKPNRTAMPDAVYRRVRDHRDQYLATRSVDVS